MDWDIPLDDERALSIEQFCIAEGLTIEQFSELAQVGASPIVLNIKCLDGAEIRRITPNARRHWHLVLQEQWSDGDVATTGMLRIDWEPGEKA